MRRPAIAFHYGVILCVLFTAVGVGVFSFMVEELVFDDLKLYDFDANLDGETLHVKMILENNGDVRIEEVLINKIEVSDLVIDQRRTDADGSIGEYPVLRLYNAGGDVKHYCSSVCLFEGKPGYESGMVDEHSGFSLANGALSRASPSGIEPGERSDFVLSISNSPDDSNSIDLSSVIGSKLRMSFVYDNGEHNWLGTYSTVVG